MYFIVVTSSSSGTRRCYIVVWRTIHEKYYQLVSTGRRQRPGRKKITIFFFFTLLYSHYFFFLSDPLSVSRVACTRFYNNHLQLTSRGVGCHITHTATVVNNNIILHTRALTHTSTQTSVFIRVCFKNYYYIQTTGGERAHTYYVYIWRRCSHTQRTQWSYSVILQRYKLYIHTYICVYIYTRYIDNTVSLCWTKKKKINKETKLSLRTQQWSLSDE